MKYKTNKPIFMITSSDKSSQGPGIDLQLGYLDVSTGLQDGRGI